MIRYAIFDLDGTILDSSQMWRTLGAQYLALLGKTPAPGLADKLSVMTIPEGAAFIHGEYDIPYSPDEIVRHITRMTEKYYLEQVSLTDGAPKLLAALRAHCVKMSIATAGDANLSISALERLGIAEFFAGAVSCSDYGAKTSPEVFLAAAELIYAVPEETMVFEDSLHAVRTAKKAGFATAAVYNSEENNQEELKKNADFYALSLTEFADNVSELLSFSSAKN
ncbi:MAG: HAD family phosphatase [Oscillospiraceae bacterium]|nr:HAD family phosphatase [Oscillospiraceae bacterium]